jgi:hypothetical protein
MFGWPVGYILLDSAFAVAMWICLGRFFLGIALPDNSGAIVMRWLVQASTPLINAANRVCPQRNTRKIAVFICRFCFAGYPVLSVSHP